MSRNECCARRASSSSPGGRIYGEFAERKLILAGGLQAENVKEGIQLFAPDVVDVSSGVEDEGAKSMDKIMTFIREVRDYE